MRKHLLIITVTAVALAVTNPGLAQQAAPAATVQQDRAAEREAILQAIRARAQALTLGREDVDVAALRAKLAVAERRIEDLAAAHTEVAILRAELAGAEWRIERLAADRVRDQTALARLRGELARTWAEPDQHGAIHRAAYVPVGTQGGRPADGGTAAEESLGPALLPSLAAVALLLGLATEACWLRRLQRRLWRLGRLVPEDLMERLGHGDQAYNDLIRRRTRRPRAEPGGSQPRALRVVQGRSGRGAQRPDTVSVCAT